MPDPTRPHTPSPPAAPVPPAAGHAKPARQDKPARDVHEGDFDDSAAGEEDPGAGVDTLVPGH